MGQERIADIRRLGSTIGNRVENVYHGQTKTGAALELIAEELKAQREEIERLKGEK